MLKVSVDRNKISKKIQAVVNVLSDSQFDALEVRATKKGEPYSRSMGYDVLAGADIKGYSQPDGTVYFEKPVNSADFVVSAAVLGTDGEYRISVYVRNLNGAWNDVCPFYTCDMQPLTDINGDFICTCRTGTGTDYDYISAFTAAQIDNFIKEVLNGE